ncbi:MAG: O-methyltransferase [Bacteroidota bacterium]
MELIDQKLSEYAEFNTSEESDLLRKINRETNLEVLMPRMLSGQLQGRLLAMISKMINPNYIVEIGTYTGYSSLCLAEGLNDNGRLITIEHNPELEDRIRNYFSQSRYSDMLDLRIGKANLILNDIENGIDLAFIDADKGNYPDYYDLLIEKVKPGGYIIADNVLWSGKVIEEVDTDDVDTLALKKFNTFVQQDDRVENVLLPVRDGLMLIRKK